MKEVKSQQMLVDLRCGLVSVSKTSVVFLWSSQATESSMRRLQSATVLIGFIRNLQPTLGLNEKGDMLSLRRTPLYIHQAFSRLISATQVGKSQRMDPLQVRQPEDQCILVDENDNVIGEASKTNCHLVSTDGKLLLHRAFSVFLFNTHGDLLLQKRASVKVTYPDHYTNTCCSHPLSTLPNECVETDALGIRHAAQRRLQFELGIPPDQAKPEEMQYITRIHYLDCGDGKYGEHEVDYIIFMQKDVDLNPNPAEVSEVTYVKRKDLNVFLSNLDAPLTPWFSLIVKHQLPAWWDNLHQLHKFYDHKKIYRFV